MQTDLPTQPALTVSELNREAKNLLERHFDWVWVEGEISQFTAASSGHWYFSLKDTDAQVRCAMFRRANGRSKLQPKTGDSVRIRARVTLYEGRGEFQLICEHIEAAGAGALQIAFEQLKARLSEEGLFASEHKHAIPNDAEHVGIVTSATGAALQDILTILERRSPHTRVYVFPVPVQGDGAAQRIADAISQADQLTRDGKIRLDVLIVGRGGGSPEDLWAFNEEVVARALLLRVCQVCLRSAMKSILVLLISSQTPGPPHHRLPPNWYRSTKTNYCNTLISCRSDWIAPSVGRSPTSPTSLARSKNVFAIPVMHSANTAIHYCN